MGIVYEAVDEELDRRTALKVIRTDRFSEEQIVDLSTRQVREARLAAKVSHDHIVTVYAAGVHAGKRFIAMEFVEGASLDTLIEQADALSADVALDYMRQAALGLRELHQHQILHRDIKPANFLVSPDGHVKLADFGLALPVDPDATIAAQPSAVGTLRFMSPEQSRGETVSERSDIYSLGICLYACLTGRTIHTANSIVELREAFSKGMPALSASDIAPPLTDLIERMVQLDPGARIPDCTTLIDEIDACCEAMDIPIPSKPDHTSTGTSTAMVSIVNAVILILSLGALSVLGEFPRNSLPSAWYHAINDTKYRAVPPHDANDHLIVIGLQNWPIKTSTFEMLIESVSAERPAVIALDFLMDAKGSRLERPEALAPAIQNAGNVVMGQDVTDGRPEPLLPVLAESVARIGFTGISCDWDEKIRSIEFQAPSLDGEVLSSFSKETVGLYRGDEVGDVPASGLLNYAGLSQLTVIEVSGEGDDDPIGHIPSSVKNTFKDKIVLVGTVRSNDWHRTPLFGEDDGIPGVQIQATAIGNLLTDTYFRKLPQSLGLSYAFLLGAAITAVIARTGLRWSILVWIGGIITHMILSVAAILLAGTVLPTSMALGGITLGGAVGSARDLRRSSSLVRDREAK